jgi:hypothetical protein
MTNVQPLQIDRLRALPKAEVHAHLEGCFEPDVLEQWATQAHVLMPRPRERLFEFEGLADFLHFLDWACGLASTRERLAELSYGYSRRLADGGAGYADVIINRTHWPAWYGRLSDMIDAIDAGLTAAEQDGLPPVGLCVSLLRTQSSDAAAELVDALVALRHPRVVALSIDGNEATAGRTGPRFADTAARGFDLKAEVPDQFAVIGYAPVGSTSTAPPLRALAAMASNVAAMSMLACAARAAAAKSRRATTLAKASAAKWKPLPVGLLTDSSGPLPLPRRTRSWLGW